MWVWLNKWFNKESREYKLRKLDRLTAKLEAIKTARRELVKELENV